MKKTVFSIISVAIVTLLIVFSCTKEDKDAIKPTYTSQGGTGANPNPNGNPTSTGSGFGTSSSSTTGTTSST